MLFNSDVFFVLLGVTLVAYWATENLAIRKFILLSASLFFYAYWFPPYIIVLIGLVAVGFIFGSLLHEHVRKSGLALLAALVIPLGVLGYFKYKNYFSEVLTASLKSTGYGVDLTLDHVYLPLGISFITFQLVGYIVDVRRGVIPAERNFLNLLLFKAYFPQLIAGPICRGAELLPQLKLLHRWSTRRFMNGLTIMAAGFFLKVVFADNLAPFVDQVHHNISSASPIAALFSSLGFGFQILADFWGYSTMAVGMSQMFGISIPINFNLPYMATSLRDFWRRWHITLSNWLRDYLYIPLGGSRVGRLLTARNLFVTMLIGGLWHGAATTFIIWGGIHGAVMTLEHAIAKWLPSNPIWQLLSRPLGWLYTMTVVFIAWVFFRAASVDDAMQILTIAARVRVSDLSDAPYRIVVLIIAFLLLSLPLESLIRRGLLLKISPVGAFVASFWLFLVGLTMASPDPIAFIYFQF